MVRVKSFEVINVIRKDREIGFVVTPKEEAACDVFLLYFLGVGFLCLLNSRGVN